MPGSSHGSEMEASLKATIVVASPYPLFIEGIKAMLQNHSGMSVISTATTYKETLSNVKSLSPDVVILNADFHDGSGIDLIKACKAVSSSSRCLLISYGSKTEHFKQGLQNGAYGLLSINVTRDELIAAITAALADEVYIHPKLTSMVLGSTQPLRDGTLTLPPRQQQIIAMMAEGLSNKQIASQLNLSVETVNTHVKQILKKLQAKDRAQAVAIAFRKLLIN